MILLQIFLNFNTKAYLFNPSAYETNVIDSSV